MLVQFKNQDKFYGTIGNVLISENEDIHLIVENYKCHFDVFDLKKYEVNTYGSLENFQSYFKTKREIFENEMVVVLEHKRDISNNEYHIVGNILVSKSANIHLIIQNREECFDVFDLEENISRFYDSMEDFEEDFPTKDEYTHNEIEFILENNKKKEYDL